MMIQIPNVESWNLFQEVLNMEKNKYYCQKCGAEMYEKYDKPALNLTCPKCGCKIATTRWEKIDLDRTNYKVLIMADVNPFLEHIKIISKIIGKNFIQAKEAIINGTLLFEGLAVDVKNIKNLLDNNSIKYNIIPNFPY